MVFHGFFHGFFKELDFKELEIHRYSLLDTINEYQWFPINEYQWISINEFMDGPSMNMVPFLWAPSLGPFLWPHWAAFGTQGARAAKGQARHLVPGTWYSVPGTWCLVRGSIGVQEGSNRPKN